MTQTVLTGESLCVAGCSPIGRIRAGDLELLSDTSMWSPIMRFRILNAIALARSRGPGGPGGGSDRGCPGAYYGQHGSQPKQCLPGPSPPHPTLKLSDAHCILPSRTS